MQMCLIFFSDMEDIQLTIISGGHWEWIIYEGGYAEMALVQKKKNQNWAMKNCYEIVCPDLNSFIYGMKDLCNTGGRIARFKIKMITMYNLS